MLASTKKHAHQKVNVTAAFFTPSCGTITKLLPKSSQNLNCQQNDCFAKSVLFQPNRCSCIFNKINKWSYYVFATYFLLRFWQSALPHSPTSAPHPTPSSSPPLLPIPTHPPHPTLSIPTLPLPLGPKLSWNYPRIKKVQVRLPELKILFCLHETPPWCLELSQNYPGIILAFILALLIAGRCQELQLILSIELTCLS